MRFPHLQGREKWLEPLGFTGKQAEWITLVCLHSGIFTQGQVEAFLGSSKPSAWRFVQRLLRKRVSRRPVIADQITGGRLICRISNQAVYRALGIPHLRHRRETSIEVTRRRLLSLDIVLDHPELPWLATEQEKVACFEQIGVDLRLLPKRIYAGRANGCVRYFPLKLPVAVGPERAVFVYLDPGMGTRTELDSWGEANRELWQKLRETGRRVEVVAGAWEQKALGRARRRLQFWATGDKGEAGREVLILRQALSQADWDTVNQYGGFDAAVERITQRNQETGLSHGRGMIDDYRLWGSRRWRTRGVTGSDEAYYL